MSRSRSAPSDGLSLTIVNWRAADDTAGTAWDARGGGVWVSGPYAPERHPSEATNRTTTEMMTMWAGVFMVLRIAVGS
jgi:hypothetical protein